MTLDYDDECEEENTMKLATTDYSFSYQHNKYGNMVLLYQSGDTFITIGPDYWCFIPTFIIFCSVAISMILFVFKNSHNDILKMFTLLIEGGMCVAYLLVATSNPGIVLSEDIIDEVEVEMSMERRRLCRKCNLIVPKKSFHCMDCDVCIEGWDHHCPWTSKCIGKGNLCRFYIFVTMIPIFLVFTFITFSTVMSDAMVSSGNKYVRSHQ